MRVPVLVLVAVRVRVLVLVPVLVPVAVREHVPVLVLVLVSIGAGSPVSALPPPAAESLRPPGPEPQREATAAPRVHCRTEGARIDCPYRGCAC